MHVSSKLGWAGKRGARHRTPCCSAVNEETLRSLTERQDGATAGPSGRKASEVVSYRSPTDVPLVRDYVIQVRSEIAAEAALRLHPGCRLGLRHASAHLSADQAVQPTQGAASCR